MALKHTSEVAIDKCAIIARIKLEAKYKLLRRFGKPGMTPAECLKAGIDLLVADVKLTKKDWECIKDEMQSNFEKRMENREKVRRSNAETKMKAKLARIKAV